MAEQDTAWSFPRGSWVPSVPPTETKGMASYSVLLPVADTAVSAPTAAAGGGGGGGGGGGRNDVEATGTCPPPCPSASAIAMDAKVSRLLAPASSRSSGCKIWACRGKRVGFPGRAAGDKNRIDCLGAPFHGFLRVSTRDVPKLKFPAPPDLPHQIQKKKGGIGRPPRPSRPFRGIVRTIRGSVDQQAAVIFIYTIVTAPNENTSTSNALYFFS